MAIAPKPRPPLPADAPMGGASGRVDPVVNGSTATFVQRRHPGVDAAARGGRFLGDLVRALQDPGADHREGGARDQGRGASLVKIDVDRNPELASQLRIQSIPAVYAFSGGRPVDGFVGALPESQVKTFVQRSGSGAGGGAAEADRGGACRGQDHARGWRRRIGPRSLSKHPRRGSGQRRRRGRHPACA